MRDEAETGSMMSSTFSLGDPLDTASTVSAADTTDLPSVTEAFRGVSVNGSAAPSTTGSVVGGPSSAVEAAEEETVEVRLNQCLFCNAPSEDLESNLQHMAKRHGMHIPEQDYLVDLEGLFTHLHEIIYDLQQCLYCKQQTRTASGAQTHMRDRGHCMIPYGTEDEMLDIGEYYDFRSTYSDEETDEDEDMEDVGQGGVKLGVARASKTVIETEDGDEKEVDEEEDGWESDGSSLSSVPTDEITSLPIDDHSHRYKDLVKHHHHSHADPRPHRSVDGYHSHAHSMPRAVYHDEYELHLPTGRVAGHRSMNKYYRQNLRDRDEWAMPAATRRMIAARETSDDEGEGRNGRNGRVRDRGRQLISLANRENAIAGVSDAKKREITAIEKRTRQAEHRARMRYAWGNEKQANSQKHFRVSPCQFCCRKCIANIYRRIPCSSSCGMIPIECIMSLIRI